MEKEWEKGYSFQSYLICNINVNPLKETRFSGKSDYKLEYALINDHKFGHIISYYIKFKSPYR
jgi:hypothetical protein